MKLGSSMEFPLGRIKVAALAVPFALAALLLVVGPSVGSAQASEPGATVEITLMVSLASEAEGPIDPRAQKIDARLRREFRYQSLKVIDATTKRLGIDDSASIRLPNGKTASVRPMSVDKSGVLLAVDIEGAVKVDARAKSGHLLVFGAGRHEGDRLVVSIEPRF